MTPYANGECDECGGDLIMTGETYAGYRRVRIDLHTSCRKARERRKRVMGADASVLWP